MRRRFTLAGTAGAIGRPAYGGGQRFKRGLVLSGDPTLLGGKRVLWFLLRSETPLLGGRHVERALPQEEDPGATLRSRNVTTALGIRSGLTAASTTEADNATAPELVREDPEDRKTGSPIVPRASPPVG